MLDGFEQSRLLCGLLGHGSHEHEHLATLELSGTFDLSRVAARFGKPLHQIVAVLGMTHLTAAEADRNLDLITVRKELQGVLQFGVKVVSVDIQRELDLLDLDGMLVLSRLFLALRLLKAILAVVHDLAHGRRRLRSDLHEIEIFFISDVLGVGSRHNAELCAVGTDYA